MNKGEEKRLLESLRNNYYVNASLSYAANAAGVRYHDALDYISESGLPFCGEEDDIGRKKASKMLTGLA